MSAFFPDTGPQPDGTRTPEQWLAAMAEDVAMIRSSLVKTLDTDDHDAKIELLAVALKEARRLQSDIRRFAEEAHGIGWDEVQRVRL